MAEFQNTIDLLGDNVVAEKILDKSIEEFNDDIIKTIGSSAFYGCYSLKNVNIPNVTTICESGFYLCNNNDFNINAPNVTKLEGTAFRQCYGLENVFFPKLETIGSASFFQCNKLQIIDLNQVPEIGWNAFARCSALTVLILRKQDAVCTLSNLNAFESAPFASGGTGGTVYVPQALIESYQNATNWSTLYAAGTCNFVAIEGSEYE